MADWWRSEVPHWLIGAINLLLIAVMTVPFVIPSSLILRHDTIEAFVSIGWALSIFLGVIFSVWYLRQYRRRSRLFSAVAWLTLFAGIGGILFSLVLRG